MDALLWRWSTAVQVTSALLIALFFVVLMRTTRRAELRVWVLAWAANLFALGATIAYWLPPTQAEAFLQVAQVPYIFLKASFVLLLIVGAVSFGKPQVSGRALTRMALAVFAASMIVGLTVTSLDLRSAMMAATISVALGGAAIYLTVTRQPASGWLAVGFAMRALLALAESIANSALMTRGPGALHGDAASFVAVSSAFDAGAEWLIALGGVLAFYDAIGKELNRSLTDLVVTKEELRGLSHRDPLTGVFNRRRLDDILNDSRLTGATILFFDLDEFKDINDVHGHHVGDEALQHFAQVLQSTFRPGDHVIRYAGDEFIVVGQGIEQVDLAERITIVRETLIRERGGERRPQIRFAVGEAYMPVGGDPDAAIRAADAAMYRRKGESRGQSATAGAPRP